MMEAAVRGSPGVATDISDWSSPRLYRTKLPTPNYQLPNRMGQPVFWELGVGSCELLGEVPLSVPNLDCPEVQLLELRLDCLPIADGHHDQALRHQVLLGDGDRLRRRHGSHFFRVVGVVVEAEVV